MEKASFGMVMVVNLIIFSHLILSSSAIPVTRIQGLAREAETIPAVINAHQISSDGNMFEELSVDRRMDLEINDYPGSGPNDRHRPGKP